MDFAETNEHVKVKAYIPAYILALFGWLLIANTEDLRIASVLGAGLSFGMGIFAGICVVLLLLSLALVA